MQTIKYFVHSSGIICKPYLAYDIIIIKMPYSVCMTYVSSRQPLATNTLDCQRVQNVSVPIGLAHTVSESITFRGYDLLKGTFVFANLYESHIDSTKWKDPFAFNPDRWLDSDNKIKSNPAFIPFSVGM